MQGIGGINNRAYYPSFTHPLDPVYANDSVMTSESWDCMRQLESSSAMIVLQEFKLKILAALPEVRHC